MTAKSVSELMQIYELSMIKDHMWHIEPCSAETGEGLVGGIKWLSEQLVYKSNTRFPNNPYTSSIGYKEVEQDTKRASAIVSQFGILT